MPSSGAGGVPGFGPNPFAPPASQQFYQPQPNTVAPVFPSYSGTAPAGTQLFYSSAQFQTVVIADNGSTLEIGAITGLPTLYPFKLLLEWGTANQEIVIITSAPSGNGPYTFTGVLRGCDGGGPQVTHATGAQVNHGVSAEDFFQIAPVFNVCAYGADLYGQVDSYTEIQAALTDAMNAGGGIVDIGSAPNVFLTGQTLQIGSNTWLRGSGATIRAISGFNPSQVGANPGISVLTSYNYGSPRQSRIRITGITFDGNESNIPQVPSWALQVECSPLGMGNVDFLTIDHCEVINAIGYSIHPKGCNHVNISDNHVLSGQVITGSPVYVAQDCIHLIDCQYVVIKGNHVNSGSLSNSGIPIGDDGICIQGVVTGSSDVTISGNVVEASAARGISLVLGGATVQNVTITGNDVSNTQSNSIVLEYGVYVNSASYLIKNVAIVGNTFSNMALGGAGRGIQIDDATNTGNAPGPGWQDVAITGNSFVNFQDNANAGIYVQQGTGLQIMSNTFDNWNGGKGIQIGDYGLVGVNSNTVTGFQVVGNTINMSTSTGTAPQGILVIDSTEGCISGNVIIGPGSGVASSYGIEILDFATATLNLTVADNSITAWSQAIAEFNGGAEPDYNTFTGNATHGCTTSISTSGAHDLIVDPSGSTITNGLTVGSGNLTVSSGGVTLAAGTTALAPLTFLSGTLNTTPVAGVAEYDGVSTYITNDTTSGRGQSVVEQKFRLTAAGGTISTIANYFGSTSNISLVSGAEYEIEVDFWFLVTTTDTVTWTFTNSAAPTAMNMEYKFSPLVGIVSTAGSSSLFGEQYNITSATATVTTGSLTSAAEHHHKFWIRLINGTGTSLKIQATKNTGGTITPGINSYWKARRVPLANIGTFAA